MTQEYQQKVIKHFKHCKRVLRLPKAWKINIKIDDTISEYANVEWFYPKKLFVISINPNKNQKIDDLIDSITHELLHILISPTSTRIENILLKIQKKQKVNTKAAQIAFDKVEENLVRHLTHVLFDTMKGCKRC